MHFKASGVRTPVWLPPVVALCVSSLTSLGGISGAFLLLPFQMSVLRFVSPAVSATNLVFNIVAIPAGVLRFVREGRMVWPLVGAIALGTLPGVAVGGLVRLRWLLDPRPFKVFVALVLLYVAVRLLRDLLRGKGPGQAAPRGAEVLEVQQSWRRISYSFQGEQYHCPTLALLSLALVVGVVGGIYGIGGGAIISPFLVAVFGLPVHTVAGAALSGTFLTSVVGVGFYHAAALFRPGVSVAPDWPLGLLFGAGGLAGMHLGARIQRFVPASWIKAMLALVVLGVALRYLVGALVGS